MKLAFAFLFTFTLAAFAGVTYTYDTAGRVATINYGNGSVITYTYDPAGNLVGRSIGTGGSGGGGTCAYTVNLGGQSFAPAGGTGVVNITANPGCSWSASGAPSWVTFTTGSGNGNGSASYIVAANSGGDRSASVTMAGQAFTIEQEGSVSSGLA